MKDFEIEKKYQFVGALLVTLSIFKIYEKILLSPKK
jgi:hypothetical protein